MCPPTRTETEQPLQALSAWRETRFFTDRQRAALAWTETVTLATERRAPDEVYGQIQDTCHADHGNVNENASLSWNVADGCFDARIKSVGTLGARWHCRFLLLIEIITMFDEPYYFTNMRMGPAAHLEGLINGILLALSLGRTQTGTTKENNRLQDRTLRPAKIHEIRPAFEAERRTGAQHSRCARP